MTQFDRLENQARSQDARTFPFVVQIPDPQDGDTVYVEPDSDFPFDVIDIRALITTGSCEITPAIDGAVIDTDRSDSTGTFLVDQPALVQANPDGSIFECGAGQALTFDITNVETLSSQLVVRFKCRRTDENVVVT